MKLKSLIALVTLSLAMWAQTGSPAPKKSAPGPKATTECACCKGMAKDHTCADCCKDGKCDMKEGASCPMMKDAKAACMGDKGCCAGMNHDGMKHDDKNASMKPDMMSDGKMGAHCPMMSKMSGKDAKGCCGMCGSTEKATGK